MSNDEYPKAVPLKWEDKVIGSCVVDVDEKGVVVVSTDITDPKARELLSDAPPSFTKSIIRLEDNK